MFAILHAIGMSVVDLFKSRSRLEAENLFLRHQLVIALRCVEQSKGLVPLSLFPSGRAASPIRPDMIFGKDKVTSCVYRKPHPMMISDFVGKIPCSCKRIPCPFRKCHPAWIRVVRQNHHIIRIEVCDPAWTRNVRRRHVQVATQARS